MVETNIRIVRPGVGLYVLCRVAEAKGVHITPDALQGACAQLRKRHGLAAVPFPQGAAELLVATRDLIPNIQVEEEDLVLDVSDRGTAACRYTLIEGGETLRELIERAFVIELRKRTDLWSLDSFRNWYEPRPFLTEQDVAAYRRFEVGSVLIEGIGIGIAVDVGTAFFTECTLAYFFEERVDLIERQRRKGLFDEFIGRQRGQKGTLLYDTGHTRIKCYFEDAPAGVTCGSTGRIRVRGETYDSLSAYYRSKYPWLKLAEEAPAVRVSFLGLDRPQFVAAELLRIRVMNDNVSARLSSVDKLDPRERRKLLTEFWQRLEPDPLGRAAPGCYPGFWQPDEARIVRLPLPYLEFGDEQRLSGLTSEAPRNAVRAHYKQRLEYLDNAGCYYIPPAIDRTIYCAYPRESVSEEAAITIAEDLAKSLGRWTKLQIGARVIGYARVGDVVERLRRLETAGTVVFVLNEEPEAYHDVVFQLADWRVKRITARELLRNYKLLKEGDWDRRRRAISAERGATRWQQFVVMNGLAVVQLMECLPWRTDHLGPYEAHVAIDVGHDRRYVAVSLLIMRARQKSPSFYIDSIAVPKPDPKHESINQITLKELVVQLFRRARGRQFDRLTSILFVRDGQTYNGEMAAIKSTIVEELTNEKFLSVGSRVELVDFHKRSLKAIRLWESDSTCEETINPPEGTAIRLSKGLAVVTSTGAATLHQGTAQPYVLAATNGGCERILDVAAATFASAQLNYSSPAVAQRLPNELKRTDDELVARAAQEIRRIQ